MMREEGGPREMERERMKRERERIMTCQPGGSHYLMYLSLEKGRATI